MNVVQSTSVTSASPKAELRGPSTVNLYGESPHIEITLDDFEVYALKRLKVLRKIEQLKTMRVTSELYKLKIDESIKENLSDATIDEVSHFILRLSYCQSEELRRWFLAQETYLFQHRLKGLSKDQLAKSVRKYAQIKPIPGNEKDRLEKQLTKLSLSPGEFAASNFYAVPFQQALDLVASRQCFLSKGYAYIPESKVMSILVSKFRTELSRELVLLSNANSFSSEDPEAERVYPLLKNLSNCMVNHDSEDHQGVSTGLTAATADGMAVHMPLCMRQLQDGLKADKKLKHWGRLQYGLFLKGAGMSMEDALLFFQRHFSIVTGEKFQKEYAYGIRHMYGKEGKRASYTPYNCSKIIMGNAPNAGDHHGCPYRHYDEQSLRSLLQRLKIGNEQDRRNILAHKSKGDFQLACQKHFEVAHPKALAHDGIMENVGNHPNAWFRASVQYRDRTAGATTVSPEKTGPMDK